MSKSRLKSDEEYEKILGEVGSPQGKTTNDATEYFNKLKSKAPYNGDDDNPFNKTLSIRDIKKIKKEESDVKHSVANIKQEIASAQTQPPNWYKEDEAMPELTPPKRIKRTEVGYNSNAQKLYENLRSGKKATPTGNAQKPVNELGQVKETLVEEQYKSVDEPVNKITEVKADDYAYKSIEDLDKPRESVDPLDLTADFTSENDNFIEAINQQRKIVRSSQPIKETITTSTTVSHPSNNEIDLDITSKLDEQLELFNNPKPKPIPPVEPVKQPKEPLKQPEDIEEPIIPPLTTYDSNVVYDTPKVEIKKGGKSLTPEEKAKLQNTLKLALDPEHTAGFTNKELDMLSDRNLSIDLKPKNKTSDIIITIILIIAIIVALYLLITSFI